MRFQDSPLWVPLKIAFAFLIVTVAVNIGMEIQRKKPSQLQKIEALERCIEIRKSMDGDYSPQAIAILMKDVCSE